MWQIIGKGKFIIQNIKHVIFLNIIFRDEIHKTYRERTNTQIDSN